MTITELLANAAQALALAQALPPIDPRVTLAIQLASGTLALLQSLDQRGVFSRDPIEVDDIGHALLTSIQRQLDALGEASR